MSEIEVKWSMRQNFGKCMTNIFEMVEKLHVVMCPGYHTKEEVFLLSIIQKMVLPQIYLKSRGNENIFSIML